MENLDTLRRELLALRKRFLNGDNCAKEPMYTLAQKCADVYNAKAKEVAKKHGRRPSLTTADKIMRQGEFLR